MARKKYTFRLPPCPSYDIEGMEAWLEDMAAEGLHLARDGFVLGFARFERAEPRKARYRLEAAKPANFLTDAEEPDGEARKLSRAYGWEFVARRDRFYVYRSHHPDAREMNTDPAVHALALNVLRKRRYLITGLLVSLIIVPALLFEFTFFRTAIQIGAPLSLATLALLAWYAADGVAEFVHITRLYNRLRVGETLERGKRRRSRAALHYSARIARFLLVLVWIPTFAFARQSDDVMLRIKDHPGDAPFATAEDFADAIGRGYDLPADRDWGNEYCSWSDLFAPVNYRWEEDPDLLLERPIWIRYNVEYHETAAPWMAQLIAREIWLYDRLVYGVESLPDLPDIGADYAAAYRWEDYEPQIVVMVVDNIVVRASRGGTNSVPDPLPIELWAEILAESIGAENGGGSDA